MGSSIIRMVTNLAQVSTQTESTVTVFLSAPKVLAEPGADVVQPNDFFRELDVVSQIAGAAEVAQDVDNVLLLAQELLSQRVACLLALLLGGYLCRFLASLASILCRCLALA
jgi:hypothetical protein